MHSILITQCLQNDFVKPLVRTEPLPNLLHVGHEEARRLLGENPAEGPLERFMQWACAQDPGRLAIIHIRDWHDASHPPQRGHLQQFGAHCLRDSEGAGFAFSAFDPHRPHTHVVNASGLNDFIDTPLAGLLGAERVGIIGVWTEAKVSFLAYELRTRYPSFRIAVCSALTASSSRAHHFMALEQMRNLLGVEVFDSVVEFTEFLAGAREEMGLPAIDPQRPTIRGAELSDDDARLVRYLFRDCKSVQVRPLSGGYSGNVVLETDSVDMYGQHQVPHVLKIGAIAPIGRERTAFERIESVLGNAAPRVADFADLGERGAIKYRYAAMGRGPATTFQRLYERGLSHRRTAVYLKRVFEEQLGRLYAAAIREKVNLLDYYAFSPSWAPRVAQKVEETLGGEVRRIDDGLAFPGGRETIDPTTFYSTVLTQVPSGFSEPHYLAYVHGDLNGANIVIDGRDNVWIIDFFHTHRGHVIRDLAKLENDLLFIFTELDAPALAEALEITDALLRVNHLGRPLPTAARIGLKRECLVRAWDTVRLLRSYYPAVLKEDVDPLQSWIATLRYAVHTLSFEESNAWQKQWALYTAARCAEKIAGQLHAVARGS